MTQACNRLPHGSKKDDLISSNISVSRRTEFEVENGSAALADSIKSIMSAISAIELHAPGMVASHVSSALEATRVGVRHYNNVRDIDPERGLNDSHRSAIQSPDIEKAAGRWRSMHLTPDLDAVVDELKDAAATGKPSELLRIFESRLHDLSSYLESLEKAMPTTPEDMQWDIWVTTSKALETLLVGQMVAMIHREALGVQTAS